VPGDPLPLSKEGMTGPALATLVLVAIPLAAFAVVLLRTAWKRQRAAAHRAGVIARLGAEELGHACFRWKGRVYRLEVGVNPLFERHCAMRLSTFTPHVLEAEVRAARNVPTKTPPALEADPFYRRFVLDAPSAEEAAEYFLAAKEVVARVFPSRWGAVSRVACEVVLSANRETHEEVEGDLEALAALAAAGGERRPRGGVWTIREGFEERVPMWHWKPEQRAALPPGTRRWCVSAWVDTARLNAPLAELLWRLGGTRPKRWLTAAEDLWFVEHAFGVAAPVVDRLVDVPDPRMAVAADQWLDGDFFDGFLAGEVEGAFAGAIKWQFHDRAVRELPRARVYARRLFDDEFSWFSGEVEILSAELADGEVRAAFGELAEAHGAEVREIERPFSFKLLKEDRLEVTAG
jgi:hypothetical protein